MADQVIYQDPIYAIPTASWNKYNRWTNQRKAAGINVPYSDQAAFWEGQMESVTNRAAQNALRREEQNRFQQNLNFQKEQADKNRDTQMFSGLAQIPLTYMMYKGLGVGDKGYEFSDSGVPMFKTGGYTQEQIDAMRNRSLNTPWRKVKNWFSPVEMAQGIPSYDPGYNDLGLDKSVLDYGASMSAAPSYANYGIPSSDWATSPDLYEFGYLGGDMAGDWGSSIGDYASGIYDALGGLW